MWYLNLYVILSLFCVILLLALLKRFAGGHFILFRKWILLFFSIGFLVMFGKKLAAFYVVYSLMGFIFCRLIYASEKYKKFFFIAGMACNLSIFLIYRLCDIKTITIPYAALFVATGLAYNLLKAIDALYMAYFAEQKITFVNYMNYILFIPTFTSGPILRYKDFVRDSEVPVQLTCEIAETSVKRIIKGLFKKIVLVELLMILYKTRLAAEPHFLNSVLILVTYYILLFFDFSGYSDIATGFGTLLGFRIPENFKKPFSSPTLTQFWRNWHASLGDWFRDHIFVFVIKKNKSRVFASVLSLVIMMVIGLWHGFMPLLILWGIYHGILLFIENILNKTMVNRKKTKAVYYRIRCLAVNLLVAFGTIFFSADTQTAVKIFKGFLRLERR